MAEFDDQHKQHLIFNAAEQQPQVPNWHAIALVVALQVDHAWVARPHAQPAQLTLDPALQHWIETRVGLFGSTARNEATASSDVMCYWNWSWRHCYSALLASPFLLISLGLYSAQRSTKLSAAEERGLRRWAFLANTKRRCSRGSNGTPAMGPHLD